MGIERPVFLIGLRASGKTSFGKKLSYRLGVPFYDTDSLVMDRFAMSIDNMVRQHGWAYFRAQEKLVLESLPSEACIVATGGGIILDENNRRFIKSNGLCIFLDASVEVLCRRLRANPLKFQRPTLFGTDKPYDLHEEVSKTYDERRALYQECADIVLDSTLPPKKMLVVVTTYIQREQ